MTYLRDIPSNALLASETLSGATTGNTIGSSQDFLRGDGLCTAVQMQGAAAGNNPALTGKIVESTDGSTWTDVAGATFTAGTTGAWTQAISFQRSKRYLAHQRTISGTALPFSYLLMEQLKEVP